MFTPISELEDRSAQGIVDAADKGRIPSDVRNEPIIKEARERVEAGRVTGYTTSVLTEFGGRRATNAVASSRRGGSREGNG